MPFLTIPLALSSPELGEARFEHEVASLRAMLAGTPPKELKPIKKRLGKAELRATGIEANTIWPEAPAGLVLATMRQCEHLVVVRPDPAKPTSKRELIALKVRE